MRYFLTLVLMISVLCKGLSKEPVWFEGVVVLESGELIKGNLSFPSFELVFAVADDGQRIALPANKIKTIRCYDATLNTNRRFESFAFDDGFGTNKKLFEVVVSGPASVLRRPANLHREISEIDHLEFDYYFVTPSSGIEQFRNFHDKGLTEMKLKVGDSIINYMRDNHLRSTLMADIIMIIKYYNELSVAPLAVAELL